MSQYQWGGRLGNLNVLENLVITRPYAIHFTDAKTKEIPAQVYCNLVTREDKESMLVPGFPLSSTGKMISFIL